MLKKVHQRRQIYLIESNTINGAVRMKKLLQGAIALLLLGFLLACDQPVAPQTGIAEKAAASSTNPVLTREVLYNSGKAPDSMLYDLPQQVIEGVWSAIGATEKR